MKVKHRIVFLFIFLLTISFFSGCQKSNHEVLSYSLSKAVTNLDPQIASGTDDMEITGNIFEGLLTKDQEGNIQPGCAKSYQISQDETTYTFQLRDQLYWKYCGSNKENKNRYQKLPIEAKDFVFTFQRLLNPATGSAFASDFYCIENAEKVHDGTLSPEKLGVSAPDETTLVIQLAYPSVMFKQLLTLPVTAPCNQDFFEQTKGQYGLSKESLLCDGPFYVSEWSKNNSNSQYVRLRNNTSYYDDHKIQIAGVNFTVRSSDDAFQTLSGGDISAAVLTPRQKNQLNIKKYTTQQFSKDILGIAFNLNDDVMNDSDLRRALCMAFDKQNGENHIPENAACASGIIPNDAVIFQKNYRSFVGGLSSSDYQPEEAKSLISADRDLDISSLNKVSILVPEGMELIANDILQDWQSNLQIYLQLNVQPQNQYEKLLKSGNYSCALVSLPFSLLMGNSIFTNFQSDSSGNIFSYASSDYNRLYAQLSQQSSEDDLLQNYKSLEQKIMDDHVFYPIYEQSAFFTVEKKVKHLSFDAITSLINFRYAQSS